MVLQAGLEPAQNLHSRIRSPVLYPTELLEVVLVGCILQLNGTPGGTRTHDSRIRSPMLYPLSYERSGFTAPLVPYTRSKRRGSKASSITTPSWISRVPQFTACYVLLINVAPLYQKIRRSASKFCMECLGIQVC